MLSALIFSAAMAAQSLSAQCVVIDKNGPSNPEPCVVSMANEGSFVVMQFAYDADRIVSFGGTDGTVMTVEVIQIGNRTPQETYGVCVLSEKERIVMCRAIVNGEDVAIAAQF